MSDLLGKTLGTSLRIDRLLGQGGMGAVYCAHDVNLDRDVAIKVMHAHYTGDQDFRARFLQEARAIAALDHPGIVRIHSYAEDQGLLYIVMDFIPGQTLHSWLKRLADEHKLISLEESLRVVRRIAWALHYAHEKGVLHRDIKPANIMLKPTDPAMQSEGDLPFHPVLTDFGLAKLVEGNSVQTQTGTTMGTPAYMSPEQCLGYEPDRRSDIYALGILLYELATGRVPFAAKSLTEAIRMHTQEPPPPPRSVNPDLPVEVENVILRALAKRKEDRYATAREMADALRDALEHIPSGLSIPPTVQADSTPSPYVSLMTRLSQDSIPALAPASDVWNQAPPASQIGATLLVAAPNGQTQRISVSEGRTLTVGRTPDNDLQLVDKGISRHHARIAYDGKAFSVTDLNSTNGTFLGDSRLLPGVSQPWPAGTTLRVGSHSLKFEIRLPVERSVAAVAPRRAFSVTFEPAHLNVDAGQQVVARLRILNQSSQVDHFSGRVEGIPAHWITLPREALRLTPNEEGIVSLTLHPPRNAESKAGDHPIVVTVVSQADSSQTAQAAGTLHIDPFHAFAAELRPQQISSRQARLELENQGNTAAKLAVSGTDPAEVLFIAAQPPQVTLDPGEQRVLTLETRGLHGRPLLGRSQRYPFEVIVASTEGQVLRKGGTRIIKPIIPAWVIPVLSVLLVLVLAGAGIGYKMYTDQVRATATAGTATAVAAATLTYTADSDGDGLTDFREASLGTNPKSVDTDGDGIQDNDELDIKTDPTLADTDGDGLDDGDEISYGVNPLSVDSDGDTLQDGYEVHELGTSPRLPDTDGDGTNDNVDPDPGKLPTPTFTPTPTNTPDATGTAQVIAGQTATAQAIAGATAQAIAATQTAQAASATQAAASAKQTEEALSAQLTQQAAEAANAATVAAQNVTATARASATEAAQATLTAQAQPTVIPFTTSGSLSSAFSWYRGSSSQSTYNVWTNRLDLYAGSKTNSWGTENTAPYVRYRIKGDFDAQVRMVFSSSYDGNFAGMGIMRLNDPKWWVRTGRFYGDVSEGEHYVVVDDDMGGTSHKTASVKYTNTQVWLKISKRGNRFDFYYSTGSKWTHIKTYTLSGFDDMYIYFTAFSWTSNSVVASFYDFTISRR